MSTDVATVDNNDPSVQSDSKVVIETAPKKKDSCANCGVELNGKFCHSCGQSSNSVIKFFGDVAKELLDDALGYDSRLKHSIFPLLFKPGRITLDYIKGKRFHYVLPFKLYLITSVLFILLIKNVIDTDKINIVSINEDGVTQQIGVDKKKDDHQNVQELEQLKKQNEPLVGEETTTTLTDAIKPLEDVEAMSIPEQVSNEIAKDLEKDIQVENEFNLCGEDESISIKWDNSAKKFQGLGALDDSVCKTFVTVINPKLKGWIENPKHLVDSIIELLPYMMFIMLPIFAIALKIFYVFSKRYYTEHLVFLLHNHSFIFMVLMLEIVFNYFEDKLRPIQHWSAQVTESTLSFISVILTFWMFIYVFLAMKRFYRQGWGLTIFKTMSLGFVYMVMLSVGFVVALAVGAYKA